MDGDRAVVHRLLIMFRERAAVSIAALETANAQNDFITLKREAHSLKGSSGYVAATMLSAAALSLMQLANSAIQKEPVEPAAIEQAITRVKDEMGLTLRQIDLILAKSPGASPRATPRQSSRQNDECEETSASNPAGQSSTTQPSDVRAAEAHTNVATSPIVRARRVAASRAAHGWTAEQPESSAAGSNHQSPKTDTTSVLNWQAARDIFGGDQVVLQRLLLKFRDRAKVSLQELESIVESGDLLKLLQKAHALRGSSGYMTAFALSEAAGRLEDAAQSALQSKFIPSKATVATNFKRYVDAIRHELDRVLVAIQEKLPDAPA